MVMKLLFMTMKRRGRWSIAAAKAELSQVVRDARRAPQVIEKRGHPVAIVLGTEEYERLASKQSQDERYRALLGLSAELREDGGVALDVPPRRSRPDPLRRRRS
jgi:prevent-host-death family protein